MVHFPKTVMKIRGYTHTHTHTHSHRFVQIYLLGLYIDFHSFVQPHANPYPDPNLYIPTPKINQDFRNQVMPH